MPKVAYGHTESPSPFSYNGAKGMGEGGGAPLHTISAAVQDALHSEGVVVRDSHCSPNAIFDMVKRADLRELVSVDRR